MQQAEFFAWIGTPVAVPPPNPSGIVYLDNNGIKGDRLGNFSYAGGNGHGFLYVDGSLTVTGAFSYRGLIYVEGDLLTNGATNFWVLGAVIVRGKSNTALKGHQTILYSSEALLEELGGGGGFVTLSWREI